MQRISSTPFDFNSSAFSINPGTCFKLQAGHLKIKTIDKALKKKKKKTELKKKKRELSPEIGIAGDRRA